MPGRHWSRGQTQAYRSGFTVGRIVDEVWILIAIGFFIATFVVQDRFASRSFDVLFPAGFVALGSLSYFLLPTILKRLMPAALWDSLPRGRFDAGLSPSAPRTYRELFRRWFRSHEPGSGG
jgi:hypothetical protein